MATNNSINLKVTNNADGFDVAGGTTARKLTTTGADVILTGLAANIYTFPGATDTLVGRTSTDTLTNKILTSPQINGITTASAANNFDFSTSTGTFKTSTGINTIGGELDLKAGTTSIAPLKYTSGTNLTSAVAGGREFDGVQHYATIDTSSGRGALPIEQYFHLTANGSAITTIANFFGTTSNINIVASAYYIIDCYFWYVTTGTGAVTFTFTNSAAPTSQNIYWEMSPVTGVVAPPGTATMLVGQTLNDATAARTVVTGSLTAATHYAHVKIWLKNSTGTTFKIQATAGGTNLTPQIGSWWHARRVSPNNIGTFAS